MAMFREHISFGAAVAALGVTLCYFYALVTDFELLAALFLITTVMSFMPDLDSDSGLPFHLIFGTFTLSVTGVALYFAMMHTPDDWRFLVGVPLIAMALTWFVAGAIFKHLTHHRGMFHSFPAMAIVGLATLIICRNLGKPEIVAEVFAAGAALGYLSHLILDELHSGISLDGSRFLPKQSLGSAMKFVSGDRGATLFTYVLLAALAYAAFS